MIKLNSLKKNQKNKNKQIKGEFNYNLLEI